MIPSMLPILLAWSFLLRMVDTLTAVVIIFIILGGTMYYFIPSWSGSGKRFGIRNIIPWYRSMQSFEFDDTIHQIRIFK